MRLAIFVYCLMVGYISEHERYQKYQIGTNSLINAENMDEQKTNNYYLHFLRLAQMVWDVLLFWARLHFPFIFGMECSTDDWCFPLSLGHLFIGVEYEETSNILENTQTWSIIWISTNWLYNNQ